jgi:hypothetical protein
MVAGVAVALAGLEAGGGYMTSGLLMVLISPPRLSVSLVVGALIL